MIQRHDHFEIKGAMSDLREVLSSRYAPGDDDKVIPSTRLRAGFGRDSATAAIRTYVDLADEAGQTVADTVLRQPPKLFTGCLRLPIEPDAEIDDSVWCESQDAAHTAVQLGVRPAASGRKPDVDLKRFYTTDNLGSSVLTGTAHIDNLGDKINVLLGGELRETGGGSTSCSDGEDNDGDTAKDHSDPECRPAQTPDIVVAGEDEDGHVGDVAGRMKLTFQNYEVPEGGDFGPPPTPSPSRGSRSGAPSIPRTTTATTNPATATTGRDRLRARDRGAGGRFLLQASVPHVRTLGITPGPCDVSKEIPAASDFELAQQPVYRCLRAGVAPGLPLGVAFRTAEYPEDVDADADPTVMAIEEGHISQMPAGDEGLEATLTTLPPSSPEQPSTLDDKPLCDPRTPSLPAAADVGPQRPQATEQRRHHARGTHVHGHGQAARSLRKAEPSDDVSRASTTRSRQALGGAGQGRAREAGHPVRRFGAADGAEPGAAALPRPLSADVLVVQDDAGSAGRGRRYEDCRTRWSAHNNDGSTAKAGSRAGVGGGGGVHGRERAGSGGGGGEERSRGPGAAFVVVFCARWCCFFWFFVCLFLFCSLLLFFVFWCCGVVFVPCCVRFVFCFVWFALCAVCSRCCLFAVFAKGEHPNDSGRVLVGASAEANFGMRMVVNLLWGLFKFEFPRIDIGHTQQDVEFISCDTDGPRDFLSPLGKAFSTEDANDVAIALGYPDWDLSDEALSDAQANTAASALALVTQLISPLSCLLHPFYDGEKDMVTDAHPARATR